MLDGDRLPADVVAALVSGLRRVREHGGAIQVAPGSIAVRDALAVAGLDRVFAFPLVPREPKPHARASPRMLGRLVAAAFAGVLAFMASPRSRAATISPTRRPFWRASKSATRASARYQGRMHVDLRMTSFPFLRQHLDGTTYYKKPSNYEVVFDKVPALAKGFDKMFADVGDPANWEKRFVITYQGEREYQGRKDIELKLVQRVRGMIDHETVLVDPNAWAIDSIRYDYYNGGHITMTQTFREVGGYSMLAEQNAEIAIPYAKAVAHGTYSDYKTNVAVDDAVFTKKN